MAHPKATRLAAIDVSTEGLDPDSLAKRSAQPLPLHLNVRVTGDDVTIFEHLKNRTPTISDSLRVRDSVRTAVFLLAMREKGTPVVIRTPDGRETEVLEHLGVFYPEPTAKSRAVRKR